MKRILFLIMILFLYGCGTVSKQSEWTMLKNNQDSVVDTTNNPVHHLYYAGTTKMAGGNQGLWGVDTQYHVISANAAQLDIHDIKADQHNIYLAGHIDDDVNPKVYACYWKNGQQTQLTSGNMGSSAYCMAVDGPDLYVAGYYYLAYDQTVACYWKNGQMVELTPSTNRSWIFDIKIQNHDIYLSGFYSDGTTNKACYWKNGQIVVLDSHSSSA